MQHGSALNTQKSCPPKKGRIKFATDTPEVVPELTESIPTGSTHPTPLYYPSSPLQQIVHTLCVECYKRETSSAHLELFTDIFCVYTYEDVIVVLYEKCLEKPYPQKWLAVVEDLLWKRLTTVDHAKKKIYIKLFATVCGKARLEEQIEIVAFVASVSVIKSVCLTIHS